MTLDQEARRLTPLARERLASIPATDEFTRPKWMRVRVYDSWLRRDLMTNLNRHNGTDWLLALTEHGRQLRALAVPA